MTVSEIMKIYKMDADQFETYAIRNDFEFDEMKDDSSYHGYKYSKGTEKQTKYLQLFDNFNNYGVYVLYQTSDDKEYLNFKNQLKEFGFKFNKIDSFKENNQTTQINIYKNKDFEIHLFITPPYYDSAGKLKYKTYVITLNKK
jgi:hypothetical protein